MKRKCLAILMGVILSTASLGACGTSEDKIEEKQQQSSIGQETAFWGEVVSVEDNLLTINLGTRKEMGEPGEGGDASSGEKPEEEEPSMLDFTGEQKEITVTEDTVITRQSMGMAGGTGENGGGEPPERPEGTENGEAPQSPDGEEREEPPQKPEEADGEEASQKSEEITDEEPPQKPEGAENGGPSEMPEGETIALSELQEGDVISVRLDDEGNAVSIMVMSMGAGKAPGGNQSGVESYDAVTEYTSDAETDGAAYTSTGADENAVHVYEGAQVTLNNPSVSRNSEDSTGGDTSSFYGVGAALLTSDGSTCIKGGEIITDAAGGAGLFAYDEGCIYAADTVISTQQDTSGGIHAAGGGSLYAWNLQVDTQGESSAAIRSDRGGGKMVIDGGNYVSNGIGSPVIYSTADIAVNNAQLTANGSEAICIEGRNSIHLYDSDLIGNMSDDERNDTTWNVILYQSMSGDSEVGNSIFEMQGGTLTAENGGMFYTTNTESTITLWDVDITCAEDSEYFLKCTGNSNQRGWGESGNNGADCLFTAIGQQMEGDIIWDSISNLDLYFTEGSSFTGAIVQDESNAGDGGEGYCDLFISKDSEWTVTGDSVLRNLYCAGTISDAQGESVTIKGTDGTVYEEGSGDYVITVENYEEEADLSGASAITQWSEYQTEKPSQLA